MKSAGPDRARRNPWLRLAVFSLAVALFIGGYYWGNQYKRPPTTQTESAILLRPALPVPAFQAMRPGGEELSVETLRGNWHLLLVAVPDTDEGRRGLALMSRIHNRLAARPELQKTIRPLLIVPENTEQTPARLRRTIEAYNPGLLAASASAEALSSLVGALGTDTSVHLFVINPQAEIPGMFTLDADPATIARDIHALHQAYRAP